MQNKEFSELRKMWGGGKCDHTNLAKEYYLGTSTGDYCCTACGECGPGSDWVNKETKDDKSK